MAEYPQDVVQRFHGNPEQVDAASAAAAEVEQPGGTTRADG
ncbi:hypothetical protein [Micromonospora salmantinae]|nr:hypothetical protein [Micromonospora salmantinae]